MTENSENAKPASGLTSGETAAKPVFAFKNPILSGTPTVDGEHGEILRSRMYELGEAFFRQSGMACRDMGWAVYPQTRDAVRRPGVISGIGAIKIKPLQDAPPSVEDVRFWSEKLPQLNVAAVMSSALVAVDIDVGDTADSGWVQAVAFKILGQTPFRRQGRPPRVLLIYRVAPGTDLRSASYRLEVDGKPTDDQIEILGKGKSVTFYGAHHSTGDYFRWGDLQPTFASPDAAPVVTRAQLDEFLDAVDHWRTLSGYRAKPVSHFTAEAIEFDGKVNSPSSRMEWGVWERQGVGKLLVDGRSEWLFRRAGRYASLNADAMTDDAGAAAVFEAYVGEALRYIARTGKWATDGAIRTAATDQFKRARIAVLEGRLRKAVVAIRDDGTRETVSGHGVLAIAGDLGDAASWIAPAGSKTRRKSPSRIVRKTDADHAPDSEKAKRLALLDSASRIALGECVSSEVVCIIDAFWTRVWDHQEEIAAHIAGGKNPLPEMLREVSALIAPTGAGKTSTLIRRFVHFVETRGKLPFAIGVFLPGHANTHEAKLVAEGAGAIDVWSDVLNASRGVRVMQLRGKVAAGCLLADMMSRLQQAQVPTTGMCETPRHDPITCKQAVDEDGKQFDTCVHKDSGCPVWTQIRLAENADLILLPHAYLTSPLPKEVAARLGVCVIDERFWPEVVSTAFLPIEALDMSRRLPRLTDTDERDGMTAMDYVLDRESAVSHVKKAIASGQCIARYMSSLSVTTKLTGKRIDGLRLVKSAKTVCGRAKDTALAVRPNMRADEVDALLSRPESEHLLLEWRFWSIVEEAILAFRAGTKRGDDTERRIKVLKPSGESIMIRVSWRGRLLLANRPAFLLDASADEHILRKVYDKRPVRIHRVDAPLHMRCVVVAESFSDQSLLPDADANKSTEDKGRAACRLSKVRALICRLAGLYGTQRILVGSTLPVERAIKAAWGSPDNVDFGHFGAFRGLDAYKNHAVAFSIGRMELPVDVLDGLAAALSYDDERPELDWNLDGTGWIGNQRLRAPQGERRLQRRDGAFVTITDSVYPEGYEWHRRIQAQWREEELRQFAGRLRPVYRTGEAPLWICAATCVPDGIVVDDVVTLDDLIGNEMHEFARRLAGVIDAGTGAIQPDLTDEIIAGSQVERFSGREAAAYASAHVWVDGEASPRLIHVAAWVPDIDAAIEESQRRLGRYIDRIEIVKVKPEINNLAIVPEPSKLDRQMSRLPNADTATRDELLQERADAEVALRERLVKAWQGPVPGGDKLAVAMILATSRPVEEPPKPPPEALAA